MINFLRAALLAAVVASLEACAGQRPTAAMCPAVTGVADQSFDAALDDAVAARWGGQADTTTIVPRSWCCPAAAHGRVWRRLPRGLGKAVPGSGRQLAFTTDIRRGHGRFDRRHHGPVRIAGFKRRPEASKSVSGVSGDDLFTSRNVIAFPWWNSLKDPAGLERRLRDALDNSTIEDLKAAAAQHRTIWVGAVNFDTGEFTQFNLSALARDLSPAEARDKIVDHIMASSAIPTFSPRVSSTVACIWMALCAKTYFSRDCIKPSEPQAGQKRTVPTSM